MSLLITEQNGNNLFKFSPEDLEKKIDILVEIAMDIKHAQRKAYRLQSEIKGFAGTYFPELNKKYSHQLEITISAHNRLYERLQKIAKSL